MSPPFAFHVFIVDSTYFSIQIILLVHFSTLLKSFIYFSIQLSFILSLCIEISGRIYVFAMWILLKKLILFCPLSLLLQSESAHACPQSVSIFLQIFSERRGLVLLSVTSLCFYWFFYALICLLLLLCFLRWVPLESILLLLGILANVAPTCIYWGGFLIYPPQFLNLSSKLSMLFDMSSLPLWYVALSYVCIGFTHWCAEGVQ